MMFGMSVVMVARRWCFFLLQLLSTGAECAMYLSVLHRVFRVSYTSSAYVEMYH